MAEYKTDDKAHAEYIEHANSQDDRIEQSEQSRLDDAELMAGEATEKASFRGKNPYVHFQLTSARFFDPLACKIVDGFRLLLVDHGCHLVSQGCADLGTPLTKTDLAIVIASGFCFGYDTGVISASLVSIGTDLGHVLNNTEKE